MDARFFVKHDLILISLGRVAVPFPKMVINLTWTYTVKKNHIGSAVSEILWYKQTDRLRSCYIYISILPVEPLASRGFVFGGGE